MKISSPLRAAAMASVAALALVAAGLGVTLVGRSIAENNRNDIAFVPVSDMTIGSKMVVVTRTNETGKTVEAFLDVLLDQTPG